MLKFISNTLILGNGQTTSLTVHMCALAQGRRKGKELDASVFQKEADSPLSFMFMHLVFLSCVHSVYNGQMSPSLQHLLFLDVKEVASVRQK